MVSSYRSVSRATFSSVTHRPPTFIAHPPVHSRPQRPARAPATPRAPTHPTILPGPLTCRHPPSSTPGPSRLGQVPPVVLLPRPPHEVVPLAPQRRLRTASHPFLLALRNGRLDGFVLGLDPGVRATAAVVNTGYPPV